MSIVPRYEFVVSDTPPLGQVVPVDNGELCKYADHVVAVAAAREDERGYAKQTSTAIMAYEEGRRDERERIRTGVTGMRPETDPDIAHVIVSDVLAVVDGES